MKKLVKQKEWKQEVRDIFQKISLHKKVYSIDINGIRIVIFPNVFSPAYFTDSRWFAETVPKIVGSGSLLEIGTGTGVIGLFCALNEATVSVTDINPDAIENARYNFQKNKAQIQTYCGNMYEPLPLTEKFDFIFWNHPFNRGDNPNENILLKSGFDFQYKNLEEYIKSAENHLKESGRLLLGTGGAASLSEIEKIANKYEYKMKLLEKIEIPLSEKSSVDNNYRIYEFIKN